jgi:hypothetical protein
VIFGGTNKKAPTPERRLLTRTATILACRIAAGFAVALALLGFCLQRGHG